MSDAMIGSHSKITIPTILTIARLLMLPVLVWLLLEGHYWISLWLYAIGAFTDFLDGWIARRYNMVTPFGTFLDPISDKIYVATLFIALIAADLIPPLGLAAIIIILAREFLVSGLREYLGPKNVQLPVSQLAKWKTAIQMIATGILLVTPVVPYADMAGLAGLLIAALLTIITGWQYLKTGLAHM